MQSAPQNPATSFHNSHAAEAARMRRIQAEADEIAFRTPGRRPGSVPVYAYAVDDFQTQIDTDKGLPWAWAVFFISIGIVLLVLIGFILGQLLGLLDWRSVADFIAPTAAQARDTGWVALTEGL